MQNLWSSDQYDPVKSACSRVHFRCVVGTIRLLLVF